MQCDICESRPGAPDEGGMSICVVCSEGLASEAVGIDMPDPFALLGPPPLTVYRWAKGLDSDQPTGRKWDKPATQQSSSTPGSGIREALPYLPPFGPLNVARRLDLGGAAKGAVLDVASGYDNFAENAKIAVIVGSVLVVGLVGYALLKKPSRAENFG
jgi:hypothetical protein